MKSEFIFFVKHNKIARKIYEIFGSFLLQMLGHFVKTDNHLVLFVENTGKSFSGNVYDIYEKACKNDKLKNLKFVWAFSNPEQFRGKVKNIVKFDSLEYFLTTLKAKYWISDNNIERSLHYKKKKTIFLNTWHGVALKKIGNDDPFSGDYDYSDIDYLCVSGKYDEKVYKTALKASPSSYLRCGMPRDDRLVRSTLRDRKKIRKKLGLENHKIILYAPTWRDSKNLGENYDFKPPINFKKWENILGDDYIILVRAHDRTTKLLNIKYDKRVRNYSNYSDVNDLLIASDVLITDYSSIVFDYSLLGKPFICFGYDINEYKSSRGMYFDPEKVYSQGVLKNEEDVLKRLLTMNVKEECKKTIQIRNHFMEYTKGFATQECVSVLFNQYL